MTLQERITALETMIDRSADRKERNRLLRALDKLLAGQTGYTRMEKHE